MAGESNNTADIEDDESWAAALPPYDKPRWDDDPPLWVILLAWAAIIIGGFVVGAFFTAAVLRLAGKI